MEATMRERECRRVLTEKYCLRALRRHRQAWHFQGKNTTLGKCYCTTNSLLWWDKKKSVGCRCRRRARNLVSPKVPCSLCHRGNDDYHPTVRSRIEARRVCKLWTEWVRLGDPDDFSG